MSGLTRRDVLRAAVVAAAGTVAAAAAPASLLRPAAAGTTEHAIALTHVTVIDATGAPPRHDMTVLVQGQQIVAVGHRGDIPIPPGAEVLDLPGRFVIPGLCDMHVHSVHRERIAPPLYIANGVTTVREMAGSPLFHQWRDRVESGSLLGPRWIIGSRIIDGAPTIGDPASFMEVGNEEEARQAVRQAKREGADFVKVYSRLSGEAYRAIAEEARLQRIPFAGHCPDVVPLSHASAAGQRSIEHLFSTFYETSTQEADIRRAIADLEIGQGDYTAWLNGIHRLEWTAATSYSDEKAARVFARLARNRTRSVPTLTAYRVLDRPDEVARTDERLKYVPVSVAADWPLVLEFLQAGRTVEQAAEWRELFQHRLAFVGALGHAGVPVLAGTDAGDLPYVFPGFSLHDELAFLVTAGFTPMQALRAATLEPARLLGLERSVGTVEWGKVADLVVLDADPLADITNTRKIHAVLVRGQLISAEQRTRMLADVEQAAQEETDPSPSTARRFAGCCDAVTVR